MKTKLRTEADVRKELSRLCEIWSRESVKDWTALRIDKLNRINERIRTFQWLLNENNLSQPWEEGL